jgi:hypothetical protein
MPSLFIRIALALAFAGTVSSEALSAMVSPVPLSGMAQGAGRIFRGVCRKAEVGTVEVAGAKIAATTYTFEVLEFLKGGGTGTLTFRQVGTPEGGAGDLGRAAGLPVYRPGLEYVIFLLPESRARLTSPAGASRGALTVNAGRVAVPPGLIDPHAVLPHGKAEERAAAGGTMPYATVRDAILESLRAFPPSQP